ncbi:MAG: nickel pincer cofactor biosynthesis protein LarB [Caldiserica bacterium]|nr:nickel pincer cofactor biosynthesis protein LarB [Caldisericota bacterium]
MKEEVIYRILADLNQGKVSLDEAFQRLKDLPFKDLGFAKIDYHREMRKGLPETVFCLGKTPENVVNIFSEMEGKVNILATKASKEIMEIVSRKFPRAKIYEDARIIYLGEYPEVEERKAVVLTGGTGDIPVAREAMIVARAMGVEVKPIFDVGVAGIHRLGSFKEEINSAEVIIVVAGMDGALPSVVAGLFSKPVVAVPTSVGYGANFQGISPLLTMLNSCAPGVVVVNIDNGYGAGYFAALICKRKR